MNRYILICFLLILMLTNCKKQENDLKPLYEVLTTNDWEMYSLTETFANSGGGAIDIFTSQPDCVKKTIYRFREDSVYLEITKCEDLTIEGTWILKGSKLSYISNQNGEIQELTGEVIYYTNSSFQFKETFEKMYYIGKFKKVN